MKLRLGSLEMHLLRSKTITHCYCYGFIFRLLYLTLIALMAAFVMRIIFAREIGGFISINEKSWREKENTNIKNVLWSLSCYPKRQRFRQLIDYRCSMLGITATLVGLWNKETTKQIFLGNVQSCLPCEVAHIQQFAR